MEEYFEKYVGDEGDRVFLSEVLCGCVRQRKALEVGSYVCCLIGVRLSDDGGE